jgi:hypothetical protein
MVGFHPCCLPVTKAEHLTPAPHATHCPAIPNKVCATLRLLSFCKNPSDDWYVTLA